MPDYERAFEDIAAEVRKARKGLGDYKDMFDYERLAYLAGYVERCERELERRDLGIV